MPKRAGGHDELWRQLISDENLSLAIDEVNNSHHYGKEMSYEFDLTESLFEALTAFFKAIGWPNCVPGWNLPVGIWTRIPIPVL